MLLGSIVIRHGCVYRQINNKSLTLLKAITSFTAMPKEIRCKDDRDYNQAWSLNRPFSTARIQFIHKDQFSQPSEKKNKQDYVPKGYDLIYESDEFTGQLIVTLIGWIVTRLAIVGVLCAIVIVPAFYVYGGNVGEKFTEWKQWLFKLKTSTLISGSVGFLLVLLVSQLIRLRSRLIQRIYYDKASNNCIAILPKGIFQKEQLTFKPEEAFGLQKTGRKGNFVINGRYCHVYDRNFSKFGSVRFYNIWFTKT